MGPQVALLALMGLAGATEFDLDDPTWWAGLPVASVALEAPEGGLPEESIDTLLRARQGEELSPSTMRLDLTTLFRVGDYRAVEADAQPWFTYDDEGELVDAVQVTYIVYPAPRLSSIRVQGNRSFKTRQILEAAGVGEEEVFYPDLDVEPAREGLLRFLRKEGFPDATVTLQPRVEGATVELAINVREGEPDVLEELDFVIAPNARAWFDVSDRQLARWARRGGLKVGEPINLGAIDEAETEIRKELAQFGEGLLREHRGWISPRINKLVDKDESGNVSVQYSIDPGQQLLVEVEGIAIRPLPKVRDALGIDERLRLTRGFMEEAPERLEAWARRRGFYLAEATVERDSTRRADTLLVRIDKGARHRVEFAFFDENGKPLPRNCPDEDEDCTTETRAIGSMKSASPEVIRAGYYTEDEADKGVRALRAFMRSTGYRDAEVAIRTHEDDKGEDVELEVDNAPVVDRYGLERVLKAMDLEVPRRITLEVEVRRGLRTDLEALEIRDAAPDVDLSEVEVLRNSLVGGAWSPQKLELLTRRIVEAHRRAGYLDADAVVVTEYPANPLDAHVTIEVNSGSLVLLRSVVLRGNRFTRPNLLRREVDLPLGQPLTSTSLALVRERLYDLDVFRSVDLRPIGDEDARDLIVSLAERPAWRFEVGAGLSTDVGLRTFGRATRYNLFGRAHRLDLFGLVGLEYRSDNLRDFLPDVTQPEGRAAITYTAKRFPIRSQTGILDILLRERRQERTWRMDRSGIATSLQTHLGRIGRRTEVRGTTRVDARQLRDVDPGALLNGEPWTDPFLLDLARENPPSRWRYQQAVEGLVLFDSRDDPFQPSRGALVSLVGEWNPGLKFRSDEPVVPFVKGVGRATWMVPIGGPRLRLSGEGGSAFAYAGGIMPLEDRFLLGGTSSLRGYQRDSVGPRNLARRIDSSNMPDGLGPVVDYVLRDNPDRYVPTGGDTRAVGTAELIVPFPNLGLENWDGYEAAFFSDFGNVWHTNAEAKEAIVESEFAEDFSPVLRYSVGTGVRVLTPVGPLQLDWAWNLQRIGATGSKASLLRDDWEEGSTRVHLSLGTLL